MNDSFSDETAISIEPATAKLSRVWQRPAVVYSFACAFAAAILIPLSRASSWLAETVGSVWTSMGVVVPVFAVVLCYACYCCVLLFNHQLTTLHIDRLQLAEYFAYSAGLLGIVLRLESLSHGTAETIDPRAVMGALAPFKVGLVLWVLVSAVRWLGEHIMTIKTHELHHEG
jgi:hypothetical protein